MYQEIKKVVESKVSFRILRIIGIAIVVLLIFMAGTAVGFYRASFGRAWGEHYNENFGFGPRMKMMGVNFPGGINYFPNAHGAVGRIIKIGLPNIIVQDKNNTEKAILIGNNTTIQEARGNISASGLKINDFVVVIGTPDAKGIIDAEFIRLIPSPESLQ